LASLPNVFLSGGARFSLISFIGIQANYFKVFLKIFKAEEKEGR